MTTFTHSTWTLLEERVESGQTPAALFETRSGRPHKLRERIT